MDEVKFEGITWIDDMAWGKKFPDGFKKTSSGTEILWTVW
jgi:hypothetical protein